MDGPLVAHLLRKFQLQSFRTSGAVIIYQIARHSSGLHGGIWNHVAGDYVINFIINLQQFFWKV